MEQTTLQQRIEERAKQRLLKDLLAACYKQNEISALVGKNNFPDVLNVRERYFEYNRKTEIQLLNEKSEEIFNALLPNYVAMITDEILQKIDEIDFLVSEKANQNQDY